MLNFYEVFGLVWLLFGSLLYIGILLEDRSQLIERMKENEVKNNGQR